MSVQGHNPNSILSALCQLWPAADITLLGLPPLCANSSREQMQQPTYTNGRSFDDLVGAGEQLWRHVKAERLRSDQADDQIEFCWLLDRQITWTGPAQNLVNIIASAPEEVRKVRSIRDKTTHFDIFATAVHRW